MVQKTSTSEEVCSFHLKIEAQDIEGKTMTYAVIVCLFFLPVVCTPLSWWVGSLLHSKSKPPCPLKYPSNPSPGVRMHALLCPGGFHLWLKGLFLWETFRLPAYPGIGPFSLQPSAYPLPSITPSLNYNLFESRELL